MIKINREDYDRECEKVDSIDVPLDENGKKMKVLPSLKEIDSFIEECKGKKWTYLLWVSQKAMDEELNDEDMKVLDIIEDYLDKTIEIVD